jgi:hypothetical protein
MEAVLLLRVHADRPVLGDRGPRLAPPPGRAAA